MGKIGIVVAVIIVIVLLVSGCLTQMEKPAELEKVSIGIQDNTITAIVLVAKGKGYFEGQGLDVGIKKYPSGKLALLGMFDDDVDFSTAADMPITSNSFNRDDYLVFSTIAQTDNGAWIIARKDNGIEKPEDLEGKKIATQKKSAVHFFLSVFLLHNQIPESDVNIVYMKAVNLPQALINGDIDAFSMRNPFIREAKDALGDNAVEFFGQGIYRQTFNLIGKKDFIKENSDIIKRLVKALIKAEGFIKENKEEAIRVVTQELGLGREEEVATDWKNFIFEISLDQSLIITLEDEARWAIKNNLTDKTEVPNYLNYIYLDALGEVKPEAVTIIY